jgi:hypothetical protein
MDSSFIGTEHLLLALLSSNGSVALKLLQNHYGVNIGKMTTAVYNALQGDPEKETNSAKSKSDLPEKLLDMGTDITLKAKEGKLDPVIGREDEIQRLIEILCRKTKNNPVLIGEAGVGKTAVVEGLAQAIVSGNVPDILKGKNIYSLEIGGLMAGTKYRGAMEERLKEVIELITTSRNIIVFIDEIHTLAQAGAEKGETSPADMLKPYLAEGRIRFIGATTFEEYKKNLEEYGEFLAEDFFVNYGNKVVIDTIRENDKIKMRKLFNLLNDIYEDGTNDTQSLVAVTILGSSLAANPELIDVAKEHFSDTMMDPVCQIINYLRKSKSARMRLENPPVYKPKKAKKKGMFASMLGM